MNENFIKEGNTLLCLFMGWEKDPEKFEETGCFYNPNHPSGQPPEDWMEDYWNPEPFIPFVRPEHMGFHTSVDSLLEVVAKLNEIEDYEVSQQMRFLKGQGIDILISKRMAFYTMVVGIVKLYNDRMKQN